MRRLRVYLSRLFAPPDFALVGPLVDFASVPIESLLDEDDLAVLDMDDDDAWPLLELEEA